MRTLSRIVIILLFYPINIVRGQYVRFQVRDQKIKYTLLTGFLSKIPVTSRSS